MERFQELAEGPRENIQKYEVTLRSVAMIYIQYSKKKSNVHLNSGLKTLSDSITLVWNNSVVTYGSVYLSDLFVSLFWMIPGIKI